MADPGNTVTSRIICIGNRTLESDSAGPRTYDILSNMMRPPHIQLIDGGLSGLNLLSLLEQVERVIFVDGVVGFISTPGVAVIPLPSGDIETGSYGHDAGLGYLMAMAPLVIDSPMPDCILVGIEGTPHQESCSKAARCCLDLATRNSGHLFPLPGSGYTIL